MKKLRKVAVFLGLVLIATLAVNAQKPGYTRYVVTKNISNGNVTSSSGGAGFWIKFEGNILWLDMGFGSQSRYVYQQTQGDGNKLYYLTAWNHGTMNQGSGWVTNYTSWMLVSPDGNTLNMMRDNGRNGMVLKRQTANGVGGMIE